jgi:uncharacterized membrane protein (UPF0127 family)
MRFIEIRNSSNPSHTSIQAGICESFFQKLRGLMFYSSIGPNEGRLFVEKAESKLNTSIHMLFMNFDITVVWLDRQHEVVDIVLARKWHPYYAPSRPAQFTLELHPSRLNDFHIGDKIQF